MIQVLFVCLGNICRSPMAEAVFAHKVRQAGLEHEIDADSAGTGDWHVGRPPHSSTLGVLAARNIACVHRARLLSPADLEDFDYILAMDKANLQAMRASGTGRAKVALLLEYASQSPVKEVPDPYYSDRFEEVYDLVDEAAEGLLAHIRREHVL